MAVGAFIAHGPDHDTWTVLVLGYIALDPVQNAWGKLRIVADGFDPLFNPVGSFFFSHIQALETVALLV